MNNTIFIYSPQDYYQLYHGDQIDIRYLIDQSISQIILWFSKRFILVYYNSFTATNDLINKSESLIPKPTFWGINIPDATHYLTVRNKIDWYFFLSCD